MKPTDYELYLHQKRVSERAERLRRRVPTLSYAHALHVAEKLLAAGEDLLALRMPSTYEPHVCPSCFGVERCLAGCDEAVRDLFGRDDEGESDPGDDDAYYADSYDDPCYGHAHS